MASVYEAQGRLLQQKDNDVRRNRTLQFQCPASSSLWLRNLQHHIR